MKKLFILAATAVALALPASAALPTYKTVSAVGNAAAPAIVYFPFDSASQVRVIYANYNTDTNNSSLSFTTGTTAYAVTYTNLLTSSVTNLLNSTNGLSASAVMVLQHGGTCYSSTVASWFSNGGAAPNAGTGVVLASGGWGVGTTVGDEIELMSAATTIPAPAATSATTTTAAFSGDALFVGNYGRLVALTITPALVTNKINTASAHYDSQSQ
ncbi:MAG TPA: hypothetical protein DCQ92_17285 [Verrucomicrobia subdivision 3 bacterium]|nr:hypothetical protein [Limisphaerales bacterium]